MAGGNDGALLAGPVRWFKDHKEKCIVVETTKDNPAGYGLRVCTVDLYGYREAQVIIVIPEILRALIPFAALGRRLAEADGEAPLITDACARLDITVGDLQRIADVCARAYPEPRQEQARPKMRQGPKRRYKPG